MALLEPVLGAPKHKIKGWDVGVGAMSKGCKRAMLVPPQMGYGRRGAPPDIPGNSTLYFEVELM